MGVANSLIRTFFSLYALSIGGSIIVLGLFSSIQGLARVLLVAPIGYISDRVGHRRKWIMIACNGFAALAYFVYAVANSWVWLVPGIIFETSLYLANPITTSIQSDSINPEKRGIALATRGLCIMLPGMFVPFLGGTFLDSVGMEQGMRILLIIATLFRLAGALGRTLVKEEKTQVRIKEENASANIGIVGKIKGTGLDMFKPFISTKTLRVMAIITGFGYIGTAVISRFQAVYAKNVIGLTNAEWGLVAGATTAVGALMRIPLGRLSDIFGRKKCILIDYSIRPIYFAAFANAKGFTPVLLLNILNNFSGETGMPAWEALIIDVTPRGNRGRVHGTFSMVQAVSETIFPSVAAFLWEAYGPVWAFYLPAFVDALAILTMHLFLVEPKRREG